jgi:hypothetical protein
MGLLQGRPRHADGQPKHPSSSPSPDC